MAIGNGLVDKNMDTDTLMEFSYQHGLIDEKWGKNYSKVCL